MGAVPRALPSIVAATCPRLLQFLFWCAHRPVTWLRLLHHCSWSALSLRCASLTQSFLSTLSEFCLLSCQFALPYLLTVNILKTCIFSHFFLSSYIFSLEEHIYYFMSTDIFVQFPKSPLEFCFDSSTCQLDSCNWIGLSNLINCKPHTSLNPQIFILILQVLLMALLYSVSWVLKMEVSFYFAFSFPSQFKKLTRFA